MYNPVTNHPIGPIGQAIDDATAGDTIRVWGVCFGNFVVDKYLTLQGQDDKATLDGGDNETVLTVAPGVTANIDLARVSRIP